MVAKSTDNNEIAEGGRVGKDESGERRERREKGERGEKEDMRNRGRAASRESLFQFLGRHGTSADNSFSTLSSPDQNPIG